MVANSPLSYSHTLGLSLSLSMGQKKEEHWELLDLSEAMGLIYTVNSATCIQSFQVACAIPI